jgi:hypothetical protein
MARRSQHSFLKRQKEIKRKETAAEKMARRQGKIERPKQEEIEEEKEMAVAEEQEAESADE